MDKKKILIIDDDPKMLRAIKAMLDDRYQVSLATSGEQGVAFIPKKEPDIILLDIMLPGMSGMDILSWARKKGVDSAIIMLTARDAVEDKVKGLDCGADDYLVKPFDIQEVLLRIRVLLRRNQVEDKTVLSDEVLQVGDIEIFPETLEAVIVNKKVKLTPTEFEILYCIMQHFNNSVTLATLLDEVWGYESNEDVRMLRVHVGGLRNKIEPDAKHPKYLHTVTNVGYKLTPFGENNV